MKCSTLLTVLSAAVLFSTAAIANPGSPPSQCEDAGSTGLTYQCFQKELKALDVQLKALLQGVPATAANTPDRQFRDLWFEHLEAKVLIAVMSPN